MRIAEGCSVVAGKGGALCLGGSANRLSRNASVFPKENTTRDPAAPLPHIIQIMIYIASPSTGNQTHPSFKQRGILDLMPVRPSNISIQGIAHQKEIAYSMYKDNIDVFIAATNRQMKLNTNVQGAKLKFDRNPLKKCTLPVDYISKTKLSSDQVDSLMRKMESMKPKKEIVGNTTHIVLAEPDPVFAERLLNTSLDFTRPSTDRLTPESFMAFSFLNAIAAEFLATQTYPAWKSEADRGDQETEESVMDLENIQRLKRTAVVSRENPDAKKARTTEDDEAMATDAVVDEEPSEERYDYQLNYGSLHEAVLVAKPSPLPATFNIGGPADVPYLPGLVFPYFDRMLQTDNIILRDIVTRYFLRNLGDSRKEIVTMFQAIKRGLSDITRTKLGAEFMHIMIGIKLALDTQTRLFVVVVAGEYAGFVLLGARFSVLIDTTWYEPESAQELQEQISQLSSHNAALSVLCLKMSSMAIRGNKSNEKLEPIAIQPSSVSNGHDLWHALEVRIVPDDDVDVLTEALRNISFTRHFRKISPENIAWALDMIVKTPNVPLPAEDPLYVPACFNRFKDRTLQVLCCFGPDSFSLINMAGVSYPITPLSRQKDPNEEYDGSNKEKNLPNIIVAVKGVVTCAQDMNKVLKDKAITMNVKERAQHNRCHVFKDKSRDLIYGKLREIIDVAPIASSSKGSVLGKRVRDGGDKVQTADDVLALF